MSWWGALVFACSCSGRAAALSYEWSHSYVGQDFFAKWTFFTGRDPTKGAVAYTDYTTAAFLGMVQASEDRVYIGADYKTRTGGEGRRSVRLESLSVYNEGLFVIELDHLPVGCGAWPAFWMYGEDSEHSWPSWGEFDIIEGVHKCTQTTTSLHTTAGCNQSSISDVVWKKGMDPKVNADNCDVNAPHQWQNQGCNQLGPEGSMGAAFNAGGGGTYAAEWDPHHGKQIRTWFWPAGTEPEGLRQGRVNPDEWKAPFSRFTLDKEACDPSHFVNMRLVLDLTFCGDLATATFAEPFGCPEVAKFASCEELVAKHPEFFAEAYWSIRGLDVYHATAGSGSYSLQPVPSAAAFLVVFLASMGAVSLVCLARALYYEYSLYRSRRGSTFLRSARGGIVASSPAQPPSCHVR